MADSEPNLSETPNLPDLYGDTVEEQEFHVSELVSENAGSMSPFGDDLEFPLPVERLGYLHPGRAERPNLAGDR